MKGALWFAHFLSELFSLFCLGEGVRYHDGPRLLRRRFRGLFVACASIGRGGVKMESGRRQRLYAKHGVE